MQKILYVVSACLAGHYCRYDGGSKPHPQIVELCRKGLCRPVCPEQLSGLPVPRLPCEQLNARIICKDGADVTEKFNSGARKALEIALQSGASRAILKSRSPSCGVGVIYDGSFTGSCREGMGVFAAMLKDAGFELFTEDNLPELGDRM